MSNPNEKEYSAQSIRVIEGLEAVRKRPAMYIGSTGPQGLHHLVYEIVDNSVDEALAGYCDTVIVLLHEDGSCSVEDNGRGIPTDIHPTEGVSAAQVALTKLHAGGKFDKDTYKFSGGLHGVGVSVVNALSEWLHLTIFRNGKVFEQNYQRGNPLELLNETGTSTKRGTVVRFKPDAQIFKETVEFNFDTLSARLRELAFLNKGLRITIFDERSNKSHEFYFEGGIVSFVEFINSKKTPIFPEILYMHKEDEHTYLEIALQYNEGYGEQLYSFVNNINTSEGGTHVAGFKGALTKACNRRAQEFNILKGTDSFSSEDVREGLVCVINIKVAEPQFEGQTKAKLGNSEVKGLVESWVFSFLDTYFEENPQIARKILQKAELAMRARDAAKKARELTRRKTVLESTILPGKLADCSTEDPSKTELFIVEGDSAGGSAKQARDRFTQAILPIRGKILNVEKARLDKILANEEIKSLIAAIGSGVTNDEFNLEKTRYHKIILMTDADVDGSHIRTLLLTFFYRYMKPLVETGYLYIAQPPLFKAKIGKKEQYLKDEKALKQFLIEWARENTKLTAESKTLEISAWHALLDLVKVFEEQLEIISFKFKLNYEQIMMLMSAYPAVRGQTFTTPELVEKIKSFLPKYEISIHNHTEGIPVDQLVLTYMHKPWEVASDFFTSLETEKLEEAGQKIALLSRPWTLAISEKERTISGSSILELIAAISKISKPYMTIQRYKGLGEMNPEQLWETSMDSERRQLLQVSIGDALEADAWFDTLMGDDVAGRKSFIEENGHFVKNLDI
ncbi:MAG: DNA topoisomerase (ATP-hydrolyzing) subunit B [Candidatus Babeliaceae bacterium]|nr:DNA topoisomerase (ATP-hydrolyzing) subunit B [Candidatus Babeliaceae bacterium]